MTFYHTGTLRATGLVFGGKVRISRFSSITRRVCFVDSLIVKNAAIANVTVAVALRTTDQSFKKLKIHVATQLLALKACTTTAIPRMAMIRTANVGTQCLRNQFMAHYSIWISRCAIKFSLHGCCSNAQGHIIAFRAAVFRAHDFRIS
jgi:hypothetical protein